MSNNTLASQTQAGNPEPDTEMAKRVMALFGKIDEVMNELNIPERDRMDVMKNLMDAIAADLLSRLGTRMSDTEREELMQLTQNVDVKKPDLQSVATFFRSRFTQEELMKQLTESTEGVLNEFVSEMGR